MVFRMRAYTHGGWAPRQRVSTTFLTQSLSCAPDGIRTLDLDLQPNALTTGPTRLFSKACYGGAEAFRQPGGPTAHSSLLLIVFVFFEDASLVEFRLCTLYFIAC